MFQFKTMILIIYLDDGDFDHVESETYSKEKKDGEDGYRKKSKKSKEKKSKKEKKRKKKKSYKRDIHADEHIGIRKRNNSEDYGV